MNIVCKCAQPIHSQQIYDIECNSFADAYSLGSVCSCLNDRLYAGSVVAELDGRVIGYILATDVAGEAEIQRIAVEPAYRDKGVGSKLMEYYISNCINKSTECIHLEVRASNIAAISIYTRYGFKYVGVRKAYYADNGEDAVLYTLTLVGR